MLTTILLLCLLTACSAATPTATPLPVAATATLTSGQLRLPYSQTVAVAPDLQLRFLRLDGDSRCPKEVACVWGGSVSITLAATTPTGTQEIRLDLRSIQANSQEGQESAQIADRTITLIQIEPEARLQKAPPESYAAIVVVK